MKILIVISIFIFIALIYIIYSNFIKENKYPTRNQLEVHDARKIILTCMDFRLLDDVVKMMNNLGYNNDYDQFILAGSSLGFNQTEHTYWKKAFLDHLELAKDLHKVTELMIIDHMNCGAYKKFYNKELSYQEEYLLHLQNFKKIKEYFDIHKQNIQLKFFLMDLNGSVNEINM